MLTIPCIGPRSINRQFKTSFECDIPYGERKSIASSIMRKNPDKIPVIVEPYNKNDANLSYQKFLVPRDAEIQAIMDEIGEQIKIHDPIVTIHVYVTIPEIPDISSGEFFTDLCTMGISYFSTPTNMKLIHSGLMVRDIYNQYRNSDGFLYIIYTVEKSIVNNMARSVMRYLTTN